MLCAHKTWPGSTSRHCRPGGGAQSCPGPGCYLLLTSPCANRKTLERRHGPSLGIIITAR
ncbi:hypothetical protein BRI6_1758 [plant metagenome]|uniref:Uncharacterized protein n=1 Tax=plant metagenome TaxID=1297885 RepID=A0A484VFN8_9ZZZZ